MVPQSWLTLLSNDSEWCSEAEFKPSRYGMKKRVKNVGGWAAVALLDTGEWGSRTRVGIALTVNISTSAPSLASFPRMLTFTSCYSKRAHVSLAADSDSNKPQRHAKRWQVPRKWAPLPIQKKTHLGDQADGWKPRRAVPFSMRHKPPRVSLPATRRMQKGSLCRQGQCFCHRSSSMELALRLHLVVSIWFPGHRWGTLRKPKPHGGSPIP